jgi:hypothetical protein
VELLKDEIAIDNHRGILRQDLAGEIKGLEWILTEIEHIYKKIK